jgi:hypothetical protein
MKLMNEDVAQLEFSLSNSAGRTRNGREFRQRRQSRAQWWFERMRQVVDRARDWEPTPEPRPEQIWFPNSHRQVETPAAPANEQRQICE